MTTVHISLGRDDGTGQTAAKGVVEWEPTTRREDGTMVILERGFVAPLVDGEATVVVDPSGLTWCWRVTERTDSGGTVRYVSVPDSAAVVEYVDLPDVDPTTLEEWSPADPEAAYLARLAAVELSDLADVDLTGLADGDVPVWDETAGKWQPGAGGGAVTSVDGQTGDVSLSSTYATKDELAATGGGYPVQYITVTGAYAVDPAAWPTTEVVTVVLTQDGAGSHAVTLPASVVMASGLTWEPGTAAGSETTAVFRYSPGLGKWVCEGVWVSVGTGSTSPGEVVPVEPTFTDESGTASDAYTIPAQSGVVYRVGGAITGAGTYTPAAGASVTITAEADTGYTITSGATVTWSYTFSTSVANTAPSMTLGAETITELNVSQPFTTSDVDGDPVTVTVDWDDGTSPAVVTSPATHTYATAGTYAAAFTPNDGTADGAVRTATYTVAASGLAPVGTPATLAEAMTLYGAAGYWKLDETTGTTAVDSSGNGRDGSIVGTVGTDLVLGGEDGYLKWVSPGAGVAPSAWVDVPSSAAFSIPDPGAITVFACAKIVSSHAVRMIVRKGVDVGSREWQLAAPAANTGGKVTNTSGTYIAESTTNDNGNTTGTWRAHATVLPQPGGADVPIVYRDSGTPQTVTTNVQAGAYAAGSGVLRIGANWVGGLAHVAVFPHALTDAHVQKLVDLARAEGIIP